MTTVHEHPISWEALSRIIITAITVLLFWKASSAIVDVVIALVLSVSLFPIAQAVNRRTNLPFLFSTIIVFILLLIPFAILALTIVPTLYTQFPDLMANIATSINHIPFASSLMHQASAGDFWQVHSGEIVSSSTTIFLTLLQALTIIVLTFYFIYDHVRLLDLFLNIFPYKEKAKLKGLLGEIARVTGQYVRGNVEISLMTAGVLFLGLLLLGVPYAVPLALFAGIIDLLPLVGSTLGAIPALLVAFSLSPFQGFAVLVLHLVYQQIENAIICPAIYNKALNLYPALGFLAVIVGSSLFGIFGAFLALPVAAIVPVVVAYHHNYKQRHQSPE